MDYQGLTIQFNGDASGLLSTLRQIDGVTTSTQRSLSQVSKALRLDPSSAALYTSQSKLTRRALEEQDDVVRKLSNNYTDYTRKLRDASAEEARVSHQLSDAKNRYRYVSDEVASARSAYETAQSRLQGAISERSGLMRQHAQYLAEQNTLEQRQAELLGRTASQNEVYVRSLKKRANLTSAQKSARNAAINDQRQLNETSAALATNTANLEENTAKLNASKSAMDAANSSVKHSHEELNRYRAEQKRYGSEVQNLTKQQKDLSEQTKAYKDELSELKDKIAVARAEEKALREELAKAELSDWMHNTSTGQFFAGMSEGGKALSTLGDRFIHLGTRVTATEAALLGMFGRSVISEAEEYGNAISQVGGYLDIAGEKLAQMDELALYWGKETQFSATEAADAMSELAKGGMTQAQIAGGALEATMQLAAAGGIDMATAATVAVNAIKVFGLGAEDATDVADALAGAANKSTAEIGSLASAFRYVSGWAGLADYSINDVSGALGLLADHGLQAEMAGTGLRNFMQRLGAPTGKAKELLDQYGVSVYDASGKMKSLTALVDELNEAFGDLDDETRNETLNTIFGARALPAAIALMEAGSAELREYIAATEREGYALEMMQARMGDLGWALEYLRGEFETFKVNIGRAMEPYIIEVANAIENLLSSFNSMDAGKQREFVMNLLKVAAVGPGMLALGAALKVVGGTMVTISSIAAAIKMITIEGSTFGGVLSAMTGGALSASGAMAGLAGGLAAVAAVVGVGMFVKYRYDQKKTQERTEKLQEATQGLVESIDDIKTGDAIGELQLYGETASTAARDFEDLLTQQAELAETIADRNSSAQTQIDDFERAKRIIEEYGDQTGLTAQELGALQWALELVNGEFDTNFQYNSELGQIYDDQGTSIQDLITNIDKLIAAREREIKAEAIQDNMRDVYQAQSQLAADRKKAQDDYLESLEEENRLLNDVKNARETYGYNSSQFSEAQQRWQQVHDETERLEQNLADIDEMIRSNDEALAGFEEQLAEVMQLPNDEALAQWFGWLSNGSDEVSGQIRELAALFGDDFPAALDEAGVAAEDFALLTKDEFLGILAGSRSIDEVKEKVEALAEEKRKAAEAENPEVEVTEEGADETKEAIEEVEDKANELDGTNATARVNVTGNLPETNDELDRYSGMRIPKKRGSASIGGNMVEFVQSIIPNWKRTDLGTKRGSANVSGNLHQATSDLKEWNRLGMQSKWGKATIALAIQAKGAKAGLANGGISAHADGYITNHSIYTASHVIGEAGIEAVLPLNNRAATQPLVDLIATGVANRVAGGQTYNLYINDARVNDDPAIRSAFLNLMGTLERKGAMNVGHR